LLLRLCFRVVLSPPPLLIVFLFQELLIFGCFVLHCRFIPQCIVWQFYILFCVYFILQHYYSFEP
jgi:hypothetical protein